MDCLFKYTQKTENSNVIPTYLGEFKLSFQISKTIGTGPIKITTTNFSKVSTSFGYNLTGMINFDQSNIGISQNIFGFTSGFDFNNGFSIGVNIPTNFSGNSAGLSISYNSNIYGVVIGVLTFTAPYTIPYLIAIP